MIEVTDAAEVICKTEHNAVCRSPEPGDGQRTRQGAVARLIH
jgi:hypothetical protein